MLAVITGASSGLGATFARKLAARGYDLLLIARREDRLRSLSDEIRSLHPVRIEVMQADLTDDKDRERAVERVRNAPDLGLLINNAGFGVLGYFWELDEGAQENMHRLHVIATMSLTHAALQNLVPKAGAGTGVINVSSVAAFVAGPRTASYHATKAWMNEFTEALAAELEAKKSPVRMQALCPGFTLTEFHDVASMDRGQIRPSLWMTADFVVEDSLRAFDRGELFPVPGWRYKLLVAFLKTVPRPWLRQIMIRVRG